MEPWLTRRSGRAGGSHGGASGQETPDTAVSIAADLRELADVGAAWEKLKETGESFRAAHADFMAAAHDAAGVQLDATRRPRSMKRPRRR